MSSTIVTAPLYTSSELSPVIERSSLIALKSPAAAFLYKAAIITVCRVGLSGIRRMCILDSAEVEKKERESLKKDHIKQFDYRPDLRPEKSMLVIVEEGGEELALYLAYEEKLASWLTPKEEE